MKYICLGYLEPGKFENMSESERNTVLDECFSYNDELRKNGHLVAEEPLQPPNTAVTVSWKNGKVAVTDGPYAETKEQLGGIQVLEARDLNHAIQLISQSPGVKLNSATLAKMPKTSRPFGVEVSTPSWSETNWIPSASNSQSAFTSWRRLRAKRS